MNKLGLSLGMLVSVSCFNISAKLSELKTKTLLNHVQVLRELKTNIDEKIDSECTSQNSTEEYFSATDTHQSFPKLNNIVTSAWSEFLNTHKNLIDSIINNERKHTKDYYIFYHAQKKEFRLIEDFIKEVSEYVRILNHQKTFEYLRFFEKLPITTDTNTFLDDQNIIHGFNTWNDHDPILVRQLLSVNLSLFGNCTHISWGECTFDYFLNNYNICVSTDGIKELFKEIFDYFHFEKSFVDQLWNLNNLITEKEGLLFQICIPKHMVNKCAYLCRPYGIPYEKAIIQTEFDFNKQRHINISSILDGYQLQNTWISDSTTRLLSQGIQFNDLHEAIQNELDTLQARLLFSWDMMLNPQSGVKIFRYSTASDESVAEFKKQLNMLTQNVFAQWIQSNNYKSFLDLELPRLCTLIENNS